MTHPKVSVVMSNYNGYALGLIENSLDSILKNDYPNLEVLMIDNASTDESVKKVQKKFGKNPRLHVIQNPVNMYSQGLNLGIRNSTGEFIAFFNNDARVEDGYFQKFVKLLKKDKNIALAQGKLLSSKDSSIIDCAGETMDIYGNPTSIGNGEKAKGNYEKETELLSVTGSCSILRREAIEKIGYFDDSYGIGYEDMDLGLRAWERGYTVAYFPSVTVFHERGATDLAPMIRLKVKFHFNKNRIATVIKHYPAGMLIKSLAGILLIYIAMAIVEILQGKWRLGLTRFSAMWWAIVNLPEILGKRKEFLGKAKKKNQKKMFDMFSKRSFIQSILVIIKR